MKKLLETKFIDIEYHKENMLYKLIWKSETENMSDEEFKEIMTAYASFFDRGGKYVLHDMIKMNYAIPPETQEWLDSYVNKKGVEAGIEKAAFVLSTNIFSSVSVQQTNDEMNAKKLPIQYFDNEEKAKDWLFAN